MPPSVPIAEHVIPTGMLFQRLMETLPDNVYFKDRNGRFLCINQALAKKFGLSSPEDAVGKSDYDFFPKELAGHKDSDERQIVRSGIGIVNMEEADWTDPARPQWAVTTKLPLLGKDGEIIGTFGISRDITETKSAREALEAQHRLLGTLIEILPCRIFVKNQDGQLQLANEAYRRAISSNPDDPVIGRTLSELLPPERRELATLDDQAVLTQGTEIINREQCDTTSGNPDRWVLLSKVPLRDAFGDIRGIVGMAADITAQKEAEARANRARLMLEEQNRQMEAELVVARDLQRELMQAELRRANDLLGRQPGGFRPLSLYYLPSERLAGDFVHTQALSASRVGILVCDVMGHGVRAALVTALVRGLLGDVRLQELPPGEILTQLNSRLCVLLDQPVMPRFVTALYATVDLEAGTFALANAGHPWPLLQHVDGDVETVRDDLCDPALGLVSDATYATSLHRIERGDRLLLFTDGWMEQTNADGEEFGRDRMAAQLKDAPADPTKALHYLADALQRHSASTHHEDDLCAVLLQT